MSQGLGRENPCPQVLARSSGHVSAEVKRRGAATGGGDPGRVSKEEDRGENMM